MNSRPLRDDRHSNKRFAERAGWILELFYAGLQVAAGFGAAEKVRDWDLLWCCFLQSSSMLETLLMVSASNIRHD